MLNAPTHKRLISICKKLVNNESVPEHDLAWAQKNAIHSKEAEQLLKEVNLFIPAAEQEDTTEV